MKKLFVGLTVMALMAMTVAPALAYYPPMPSDSSDVTVTNNNSATVSNSVNVSAITGYNYALGGSATGKNATGGSNTGDITTGDAYARAKVVNVVNSNTTKVCAPCVDCEGNVEVANNNGANVGNGVGVLADTGENVAAGGDATATGGYYYGGSGTALGGNNTAGDIETGNAYSSAKVVNVVNKNITRIRR